MDIILALVATIPALAVIALVLVLQRGERRGTSGLRHDAEDRSWSVGAMLLPRDE
ncbi:hypothetical protein SAMN06264364_11615 [Quadrisphaera granulorum]|uniref:Uncharacterized protein n=1 Tax=Quadrisphaera granulorum TaxID=317664 RepID=A0A316A5S6_9ACTN|nr:hypothetical protein [Quadrisphaera granulorum]PWJ52879.1 hypothetical protein BXY45_11615 [Quadrisphaera granulorum]SZE97261.1 hypothetical protein SAMN06264364_11615 [Quadrisphaera granulorum]